MATRRRAIYTEAFSHTNPIPAACRLGNLVMTGIVNGIDPARPGEPGTLEEQCALMFSRIPAILEAAGASVDDIVKINIAAADVTKRGPINDAWVRMFPDAATRPVRHTVAASLDRGKLIQCDVIAWVQD